MSDAVDLRLRHPALDFWIDVRRRRLGASWLAVADLTGAPEIAVSTRSDLALLQALWPLGPELARELARSAHDHGSATLDEQCTRRITDV